MVVFVSVSGYTTEGVLGLLSDTAAACGKTPRDGSWRLQSRLSFELVRGRLLALSRGKILYLLYLQSDGSSRSSVLL